MEFCNGMMYAVKSGDTLYSISMKYNIPLAVLLRANPYVDVYNLQVGETICVPVKQNQGCRYTDNGRCIWERGENTDESAAENASSQGMNWRESGREMAAEENIFGAGGYKEEGQQGEVPARSVPTESMLERREEGQMPSGSMSEREGQAVIGVVSEGMSEGLPTSGPMSDRGREEQSMPGVMQMRPWVEQEMQRNTQAESWEEQPMPGTMQKQPVICCKGARNRMDDKKADLEGTMDQGSESPGNNMGNSSSQWERYVTQPGDTLGSVLRNCNRSDEKDMEEVLEDFVEKNGVEQIYLLPGIAYSCKRHTCER